MCRNNTDGVYGKGNPPPPGYNDVSFNELFALLEEQVYSLPHEPHYANVLTVFHSLPVVQTNMRDMIVYYVKYITPEYLNIPFTCELINGSENLNYDIIIITYFKEVFIYKNLGQKYNIAYYLIPC